MTGTEAEQRSRERFERALGTILLFLGNHPLCELLLLDDVRERIVPAVKLRQYAIIRERNGAISAYVAWAKLDAGTERRLAESPPSDGPPLSPHEWDCGAKATIIDVVTAAPGREGQACRKVKRELFPDEALKALLPNAETGAMELTVVE